MTRHQLLLGRWALAIFAAFAALAAPTSSFGQPMPYGWTVSASNTDPLENTGSIVGLTAYLWFYCANPPGSLEPGMSAAEFDLVTVGGIHLATITQNGFLNAGGTTNLLLAVGGCPAGPQVAANLLISAVAPPVRVSIVPSAANGNKVTVDCSVDPSAWPIGWIGFNDPGKADLCNHVDYVCFYCHPVIGCDAYLSGQPCPPPNNCDDCPPVSVDRESWGSTKAKYRD